MEIDIRGDDGRGDDHQKAQVQVAVVQDEIRDGYDRILEGKIIWEKISLPGILYGMEVADVEDRVMLE